MATFSQKAAAFQKAVADHKAVDTATTRQAVADTRAALRDSAEAGHARSFHNHRVSNGSGGQVHR
ncbi:hypothetical protein [Micromonospora wenchangensis]|uniref:hypothetical protein n=1 Tax=Micromonospora wenchangensis TaxID=1185415 RepID=UPI0037F5B2AA